MDKEVPTGYSTRPSEGFHQEVNEVFGQTNFKNADPQLARIDENKGALALIRMAIDEYDALCSTEKEGEDIESFTSDGSDLHWSLGSPLKWETAEALQHDLKDNRFVVKLCALLNNFVLVVPLPAHEVINVCNSPIELDGGLKGEPCNMEADTAVGRICPRPESTTDQSFFS
ncbi:hypothetical protein B0H14DRAFT_2424535 [Mycena olivaceomarginata]|nr:hypothetical protein B0H14DRAFT_2424535 [Mycena olivaceomarginata]